MIPKSTFFSVENDTIAERIYQLPIMEEEKPGGGVPLFHYAMRIGCRPGFQRIKRSQGAVVFTDILFDPGQGSQIFIPAEVHSPVRSFTAVLAGRRLGENVKQPGMFPENVTEYFILVIDVVNPEAGNKPAVFHGRPAVFNFPQGLCQIGLSTENADI